MRAALGALVLFAVCALSTACAATRVPNATPKILPSRVTQPQITTSTVEDRGFSEFVNGHSEGSPAFYQPVDPRTRRVLAAQLSLARRLALRYPTVKDALRAGYVRVGPFAPTLGAHYIKFNNSSDASFIKATAITDVEILNPLALIYDGTHDSSPIAGLMYYTDGYRIPRGFAGPNDVWHYHLNVCLTPGTGGTVNAPFGADTTATKAQCDAVHGQLQARTDWMLHVWVVPGYDSPLGVFSHANPAVTCRDGTYRMLPIAQIGDRSSICVDGGE